MNSSSSSNSDAVHIPYVLEQDEDGVWCASASTRPGATAFGEGDTPEDALADLRAGILALLEEYGPADELELVLDDDGSS